ncbi:MAG: hypothetical protein ACRECH_12830, partial [Nitrososphaerales archaeon]
GLSVWQPAVKQRLMLMCHFGCDEVIGLFYFPQGCVCFTDQFQYLCLQHAYNATPICGMYEVIYWGA